MVCDSRIFVKLDLKKTDPKTFVEALKSIGKSDARIHSSTYPHLVVWDGGLSVWDSQTNRLTRSRYENEDKLITRAYQRQVGMNMAKKQGWQVRYSPKNPWVLQLSKRQ